MSPETDHKPEPLAPEPPNGEPAANNFAVAPAPAAQPQSASGAATAVARAQEPPSSVAPASEPPGAHSDSVSRDGVGDAVASEAPPEAAASETNLPAEKGATVETTEGTETTEPTETMDQLLDQFSIPQPAGEGEIFDGRVLAVTDAGVVVDVGGKFEGLVPAQEFLDSGEPHRIRRRADD